MQLLTYLLNISHLKLIFKATIKTYFYSNADNAQNASDFFQRSGKCDRSDQL